MGSFIFHVGFLLTVIIAIVRLWFDDPLGELDTMHLTLNCMGLMIIGIGLRVFHPSKPRRPA